MNEFEKLIEEFKEIAKNKNIDISISSWEDVLNMDSENIFQFESIGMARLLTKRHIPKDIYEFSVIEPSMAILK